MTDHPSSTPPSSAPETRIDVPVTVQLLTEFAGFCDGDAQMVFTGHYRAELFRALAAALPALVASHSPGTPAPAETPERHHDGSAPVGAPALSPADTARLLLQCARSWDPEARLVGNVRSKDVEALCLHCMAASRAPVAPTGIAADPDATATEVSSLKLWPARQRTYIGAIQYALDTLAAHGVGDTNGCADLRLLRDCIADPAANWQARPPAFAPTHTDMMITPEAIAAMDFPDTSAASPSIAATPDAPRDPTPEPIGMDDPDGILLGAYRKAVMDAWLSGSIQTRNHRNALFSQIVGRMRRARRSPNTPTPDTQHG